MIARHWFPVILGGLSVLLASAFFVIFSSSPEKDMVPAETLDARAPAMTDVEYQSAIRTIVQTYHDRADAEAAYDALLYLDHIPASMKDVHIALVGAFGKLMAGQQEEGSLRLEAVFAQYSWLTL